MTALRQRVSGVVLLREPDGDALLQLRDDKPGLPHANLWVPPGGHCEPGERAETCAIREFFEETGYRCHDLRLISELDVDGVPFSPPIRLTMFWDVYDGRQAVSCREGQALVFVPRTHVPGLFMPDYLVDLWDRALAAWQRSRAVTETHATTTNH
ncbi:MAG: NUDIX domain-containing protein [Acidimicrobiia bacterium]|nr:NUDIX domain-containing protein [Acidimicrobiia bacterium]